MAKCDKCLPLHPVVGDRIRIKPESMKSVVAACKLAGWTIDEYAIRIVTRTDPFAPGGGKRLYVDGEPHMFTVPQVMLAWNTDDERREMLKARGWTQRHDGADWRPPHAPAEEKTL